MTFSSFRANWSGVSGAIDYRLDVSTSSSFTTYVPGYQDLHVGNVTGYNVTGLNPSTTYYYRVRAYNGCATSANSSTKSVLTLACIPAAPSAQRASNVTATSFTANWRSCKRLDRLSVGRSQRLVFHQLRTRLSEFECRKRDQLPRDRVKSEHDLLLPRAKLQWVCSKRQFQRHNCADDAVDQEASRPVISPSSM